MRGDHVPVALAPGELLFARVAKTSFCDVFDSIGKAALPIGLAKEEQKEINGGPLYRSMPHTISGFALISE